MPQLTVSERTRLARLATDRVRRAAMARLLGSPLLRWRYGAPIADELLIVPQDLRTADPSFADEVEAGHFGFAGACAYIGDGSPFDLPPPSADWERELHGFGWLRHLRAAEHDGATDLAVSLVTQWIARNGGRTSVAWEPAVIGRRLISWISDAPLLLDSIEQSVYDQIADSLGEQLIRLSATWRDAADGFPRLLSLTALVLADLCVAGHDRHLREIEESFAAELERQILPDGGHISRNPGANVELLLDFLPLRQCFAVRDRAPPPALNAAIERSMPMLRCMRLGDGVLARFNGMGAPNLDALATVFTYSETPKRLPAHLPADQEWRATARATASHNALCLGGESSSRLVRHDLLESLVGAPPIRLPEHVRAKVTTLADASVVLEAQHDGYLRRFGVIHRRRLILAPDGLELQGFDRLGPLKGHLRLPVDLPFAVHFHVHPEVGCSAGKTAGTAELALPDGEVWMMSAAGAELSIEESVHFADLSGPRRSMQIVLRGACFGESEIKWALQRQAPGPAEAHAAD